MAVPAGIYAKSWDALVGKSKNNAVSAGWCNVHAYTKR